MVPVCRQGVLKATQTSMVSYVYGRYCLHRAVMEQYLLYPLTHLERTLHCLNF